MSPKLVMFMVFTFVAGSVFCLMMEGAYIGEEEVTIMNELTGYSVIQLSGAGAWAVPKMAMGFLLHGLPKLLMWDYAFFAGEWGIVKWFLCYPISAGVVFGLIMVFISAVQGIFATARA